MMAAGTSTRPVTCRWRSPRWRVDELPVKFRLGQQETRMLYVLGFCNDLKGSFGKPAGRKSVGYPKKPT
jgi:hypothetical protein